VRLGELAASLSVILVTTECNQKRSSIHPVYVATWIDGNAQRVYFDDLTYTWRQE
jgi:hypothetical protein